MSNIFKIFETVNGASFVGIDTKTTVKLLGGKKNPMQGRVEKVMEGASVMVFQNKSANGYQNMVQRRLEQEGKSAEDFQLKPRAWGQRISGAPFVEHKGNLYLEVIFLKPGSVSYLLDGRPIAESDIEGLPSRKPEGQQGGLEDKVIIRTFKVDSLTKVRIDHNEYDNITA